MAAFALGGGCLAVLDLVTAAARSSVAPSGDGALTFPPALLALVVLFGLLQRPTLGHLAQRILAVCAALVPFAYLVGQSPTMELFATTVLTLTALGTLASAPAFATRAWLRRTGQAASLLAAVACICSAPARVTDTHHLITGATSSLSVLSALALAALNLALTTALGLWAAAVDALLGERSTTRNPADAIASRHRRLALGVLAAATLGVLGFALGYLRLLVRDARDSVTADLTVIAELKAAELGQWRGERLADARTLTQLLSFRSATLAPDALDGFLPQFRENYGYHAVVLFDGELRPLPSLSSTPLTLSSAVAAQLRAAVSTTPPPVFEHFVRDEVGRLCFDVVAALFVPGRSALAGAVLLRVAATDQLQPIVHRWPQRSPSGECVLFRREGSAIVYLTDLRDRPGSALTVRVPVSSSQTLAVQAAAGARAALLTGVDYRGVPAIGVARPVPGTLDLIIAKIDAAEAFAPVRDHALRLVGGSLLLLLSLGLGLGILWRHNQQVLLTNRSEAERDRAELAARLALMMQQANDAIFVFDASTRIVEANARAAELYRRTPEEMLTLFARDLRAPETQSTTSTHLAAAQAGAGTIFETLHVRRDGTVFPVEVSARPVDFGGHRHVLSIVRDVTERKLHEREIERLNRIYHVVSEINQAIAHSPNRPGLFARVTEVLVEFGGFELAWIGLHNPATHLLEPAAVAGDRFGYVGQLKISADENLPAGRGPSGTAFRTGRTYVCPDFFADPSTVPWRDAAGRSGINSSIALVLRQDGQPAGLLNVYAGEKNFFGPREIALLEESAADLSFALDVLAGAERRHHAEQALRESESRLAFLLSATPVILYSLRLDGGIRTAFISDNVAEILGHPPATFLADPGFWLAHVHPDDIATAAAALTDSSTRNEISRDYRFHHQDGTYRWMHDYSRVIRDNAGQPTSVVGYWLDITDRREGEERYRLIAENTADMIWIVDLITGCFTYVSPAAYRLRGYRPEELIGRPMAEVQTPAVRDFLARDFVHRAVAFAGGDETARNRTYEIAALCKDGSTVETEVATTLMRDAAGRVTHLLGVTRDITERKRAQKKLRQLSRIIEQAPVSVAITDLTGKIEYANPFFCALTGYTLPELIGQNPRVLKSGETPPEVYRDMWATLSAGRVWRGEVHNQKKNGERFVENAIIAPVVDEAGHVTHYVALKEDITERQRTATALAEAQQNYRLIADHTHDVIWLYDLTFARFTYVSPSVKKLRGYTPEEIVGQSLAQAVTPDSLDRIAQLLPGQIAALAARDESGLTVVAEIDQVRKDGSVVPTEVVTTLLPDAAGRPGQLLGVTRDITERRRAQAQLEQFNAELEQRIAARTADLATRNREIQALLNAIPDVVLRLRLDGAVINYQSSRESAIIAALGPDAPVLTATALDVGRRALAQATTVAEETSFATPLGPLAVEVRAAPIGPDEFVAFVRDITARKRLEAETAAMLERERQVSEMKTRFISVTSHEFRTPMATAMGSIELLHHHLDQLTPAKREELFARVGTAMHRLTEMLDDVLTFSRIDAGRMKLSLVAVDLPRFLHSLVDEVRLGDRDAHLFHFEPAGDAEPFTTDSHLLHHIVANLLTNAARYSPPGTVITTRLHCDALRAVLSVEDQGIGIPEADRPRLFQPFERGSNVGNIKGTGLGLSIVKRLVDLLGGTITLESAPGRGTRFTLEIPRPPTTPT